MSDTTFFLNPHCVRCREPLHKLSAEELRRQMTKQHIPPQPMELFTLEPGFEPNLVRVGSFLVFGDRKGRPGAEIQLPIAHLAAWFDNAQIEKW